MSPDLSWLQDHLEYDLYEGGLDIEQLFAANHITVSVEVFRTYGSARTRAATSSPCSPTRVISSLAAAGRTDQKLCRLLSDVAHTTEPWSTDYSGTLQYDNEHEAVPSMGSQMALYTLEVTEGQLAVRQASPRGLRWRPTSTHGTWSRDSDEDPTKLVPQYVDSDDEDEGAEPEMREEPDWDAIGNPFDGWRWPPMTFELKVRLVEDGVHGSNTAMPWAFLETLVCARWC